MIHLKDHFIVAEIERNKKIHGNKTPIAIADSMYSSMESLSSDMIQQRYFKIFLAIVGITEIEYTKAEFVRVQNNECVNDCGVICLQRMYALAITGKPSFENLPVYLQSTRNFRCFMLYKIFECNRKKISPYMMYHEQKPLLHYETDSLSKESATIPTNLNVASKITITETAVKTVPSTTIPTNLNVASMLDWLYNPCGV